MRFERIKKIRAKLRNHQVTIGTWQQIPHASISEILGQAGYEWVAVDMEHGSIGVADLPNMFRAIELGGALPLARIADSKRKDCKQALDAGAGGIIAPMIENAEQLKKVRNACCWPPTGNRGVGFSRANLFGKNFDSYKNEAQSPLLIAQIEHINAVKNLENILQLDGLDAIMIGPYDLSASMGITGEFNSKEFNAIMDSIISCCKKYDIPFGDHVVQPNKKNFKKRVNQGFQFLAFSTDSVFLNKFSVCPDIK